MLKGDLFNYSSIFFFRVDISVEYLTGLAIYILFIDNS
jgi:hypothetical protein